MKKFAVLGLGRFEQSVVETLAETIKTSWRSMFRNRLR